MVEVIESAFTLPSVSSSRNLFIVNVRKLRVIKLSASAYWRSMLAGVYVM